MWSYWEIGPADIISGVFEQEKVLQLAARDHLGFPEAGGGKEGFSPAGFKQSVDLPTIWPPELQDNMFLWP